jgi:amino acid adenylation domain-containing protein
MKNSLEPSQRATAASLLVLDSQPGTESAADKIAAMALLHPEAPALRAGSIELSYATLMAAVDELALELLALGVSPDVPVGICIPRSPDQVIAILAALRAGGAFMPLDPTWPIDRIRHVLDDAEAPIAIAPARVVDKLAAPHRRVLASEPEARTGTGTPLAINSSGENLAYIIYTSGSTGEPKGVEITQGNLRNLIDWHIGAFGIGPGDRVSCQAGLSFDAVVWELLPALSCGAAVHLAEDQVRTSSDELRRWLVAEKITIAFVPTALAEPLITSDWPAETRLRTMLTGGDMLHVWPKPGLPFAVVNNYGPSECTVVATSGIVAGHATPVGMPTIGRPIANSEIHILDETGRPVLRGQVGEIHIGGANVGRGYRHRPSLSGQAFVTREGVGRLYRTGDLGRWTDDGEVAFHGRCDEQVKVRGYRVEPNEISAALDRHPAVLQSAVVAEGDGSARRLVAYLVPAAGQTLYGGELRDFLALTLPVYMLPDAFVRLASLPLTAHGKLDRAALPQPTAANTVHGSRYRAPDSDVERRIATLIEDLLGIERVGADDNFFLLGGHSLLGTQLVLRLREAFGAELRLRDLFEGPTVAKLAKRVEEAVIKAVSSMDEEEVRRRLIH